MPAHDIPMAADGDEGHLGLGGLESLLRAKCHACGKACAGPPPKQNGKLLPMQVDIVKGLHEHSGCRLFPLSECRVTKPRMALCSGHSADKQSLYSQADKTDKTAYEAAQKQGLDAPEGGSLKEYLLDLEKNDPDAFAKVFLGLFRHINHTAAQCIAKTDSACGDSYS